MMNVVLSLFVYKAYIEFTYTNDVFYCWSLTIIMLLCSFVSLLCNIFYNATK